jgi:hypothetical protein
MAILTVNGGKKAAAVRVMLAAWAVWATAAPARADDFRVDNAVFTGEAKTADSQGVTIFRGGLVYDFLDSPLEVIVLNPTAGRFQLVDPLRQVAAELSTREVTAICEGIKELAAAKQKPLIRFLASPAFQETLDRGAGELTLGSSWMTYKIKLTPASPGLVKQYREFSDWYAQLNTALNPAARPQFARLRVNEAVARQKSIPREVELTLIGKQEGGAAQEITVRSKHKLVTPLTAGDLARITATQKDLKTFKAVSLEQYRNRGNGRK